MLLKSNTFLDQTNRFASATNTLDLKQTRSDNLNRKAVSSNPVLQTTSDRSADISIKFNLKPQPSIPSRFLERWSEDNFKNSNKFSNHDNRNVIQDYGEYFGQGYGKKYIETNFYRTEPTHLSHEPADPPTYMTTNKYHYNGSQLADITKNYRKFPRSYSFTKERSNLDLLKDHSLDITPQVFKQLKGKLIYTNQNYILSKENQQIHSNPWKYHYKKSINVYPNIKLQQIRKSCVDLSKY